MKKKKYGCLFESLILLLIIVLAFLLGFKYFQNLLPDHLIYNPERFDDYKLENSTEQELSSIISHFQEMEFHGTVIVDTYEIFGNSSGSLEDLISSKVDHILKSNDIKMIFRSKDYIYFALHGKRLDENCGLLYLPESHSFDFNIKKERFLKNSEFFNGKWYFVEAKL